MPLPKIFVLMLVSIYIFVSKILHSRDFTREPLPSSRGPLLMAEKLPSQAWSTASLAEGNQVLKGQQVKLEPDTQAMEDELKDPDFSWGLCLPFCMFIRLLDFAYLLQLVRMLLDQAMPSEQAIYIMILYTYQLNSNDQFALVTFECL